MILFIYQVLQTLCNHSPELPLHITTDMVYQNYRNILWQYSSGNQRPKPGCWQGPCSLKSFREESWWLVAEREKSLPLSSDGLFPCIAEGPLLTPLKIFQLDLASALIQYDLTLILTLITLKRPYFKIRSHSEVLGGEEFGRKNIQRIKYSFLGTETSTF